MRVGFLISSAAVFTLCFHALYACSSDPSASSVSDASDASDASDEDPNLVDGGSDCTVEPMPMPGRDAATQDSGDAGEDAEADAGPRCNPFGTDDPADGGVTLDAGAVRRIFEAPGEILEGPQWVDAFGGALVFSERKARRVARIGIDGGTPEVVRTISGTALEPAGNAFREPTLFTGLVASAPGVGGAILQTSLDGDAGPSLPLADGINAADLVLTPSGAIFFTDPRALVPNDQALGLFRLAPDGGAAVPEASLYGHVRGVALSASGSDLAVAMTDDKFIVRLTLASDGSVLGPASPLGLKTTDHPVAVATDQVGNAWMAETTDLGSTQSGRVEVRSRYGEPLGVIPFPSERPTGVAFGGPTDTTVFITTETGIFVYESLCPGVR